jgi:elongation factor G
MVFVRVYSGKLDVRSVLQISQLKTSEPLDKERAGILMELYADDYESVSVIEAGNIGAIVGLKNVKTGDTLVSSKDPNPVFLSSITIPPPVFIRSVQVDSLSEEKSVQIALQQLLREDPSLSLTGNEDTGQTLLSGMGELHLEIAGERLLDVYKAKCKLGRVEIAYRETIGGQKTEKFLYDKEFFGKVMKCEIELEISKIETDDGIGSATNNLEECVLDESKIYLAGGEGTSSRLSLSGYPTIIDMNQALQDGVNIALSRGPKLGFPISMVSVKILSLGVFTSHFTTLAAIRSAAHSCLKKMMLTQPGFLLEPVMNMSVTLPSQYVGAVSRDLSGQRRGMILDVEGVEEERTKINCEAPLANLVGYASSLRGLTQGTGEWIMDLKGYQVVKREQEEAVIKMMQGQ